ncbi:hypothetical protein [uncultured Clostridium sp.]|uniref:hypothetical protein n=1 Tax=uncultured Clostridium sp. TaxID=59620 RepID=UPI0026380722|nr:hypothetical protein [uncultured Clostridium sp.]
MFNLKNNYKFSENKYEVKGNVVEVAMENKKGKEFVALIDAADLERVKEQGIWFVEWGKELNDYSAQNINETLKNKKGKPLKQSLQGFILGVSAKAPIKHINANYLDNRKENLEIVDTHVANEYEVIDETIAHIILKDKYGREETRAIVSKDDIDALIKEEYNWAVYRGEVVANTTEGRVYLDELLLNPKENEIVHHINLNPLDNKRENIEIHLIEE